MKILELQLRAFGAFSDFSLDLSSACGGLHLIYGPNEAGKSTARRAILGFFYGLPAPDGDDFRHGRKDLRVAARLQGANGHDLAFTRRKGKSNDLLDFADAQPMSPEALEDCLSGVERSMFETLFCLDHEELVKGSESILQGNGAVGEALFSAGLGGANLREYVRELDAEADKLFKRQGQNQRVNAGLKTYRETRDRIRSLSLSGVEWETLERKRAESRQAHAELTARREARRTEREHLERLNQALPWLGKKAFLAGKIATLGAIPPLPDSFPRDRAEAAAELRAGQAAADRATRELDEIGRRLAELEVRENVLNAAGAINALQQGVRAFREDQAALPGRRGEVKEALAAAGALLAELRPGLTLESAGALRLTVLQRESIRRLAMTHAALHAAEAGARETLEKAEHYLEQKRAALAEMTPPADVTPLVAALRRVQKRGDLDATASAAAREAAAAETAARRLAALPPPWKGAAAETRPALAALANLPLPLDASILRFETDFAAAAQRVAQVNDELARYTRQNADAERAIEAMRRPGDLPSDADLENARAWRDWGWRLVSEAWAENRREVRAGDDPAAFVAEGQSLAEAYLASVGLADAMADRLRLEANRVAQTAALQANVDSARRRVAEITARRDAAIVAQEDVQRRWLELWKPAQMEPLSPAEMRAWLGAHERFRQALSALAEADDRSAVASRDLASAREELLACLPKDGSPAESLDALVDRTQAHLADVAAQTSRRSHAAREIEVIETSTRPAAEKKKKDAHEGLESWSASWAQAVKTLPLEREIAPLEAESVLSRIEALFDSLGRAEAQQREIELREVRLAAFEKEATGLIERLDARPELADLSADAATEQLGLLLRRSELEAAELEALEARQLAAAEALDRALEVAAGAQETLAEFCRIAGCEGVEGLESAESHWRQGVALIRSLAELEEQLASLSAGRPIEELETKLRAVDADALPGRIEALQIELKELDAQIEAVVSEAVRAEEALAKIDRRGAAAEAAEDAQSLLAGVRERAVEYARLKLAGAVLRREAERFRRENQSPLVRRAGVLFSELTGGSFAGLSVDFDGAEHAALRGVRGGNGSAQTVGVEGMSEGTRDQLYLALRLASLERTLNSHEALPLILDDILVNFDDARARCVLRVLRDFAEKTQVLLFIHHEHLLALARETLGADGFCEHRLPAR